MRIIIAFAVFMSAISCYGREDAYSVKGKVGNIKDRTLVTLHYSVNGDNKIDSTYIMNNQFVFKGITAEPFRAYAAIIYDRRKTGKSDDYLEFYVEKGEIRLTSPDSIKNATVSGSPVNDEVKQWAEYSKSIRDEKTALDDFFQAAPEEKRNSKSFIEEYVQKNVSIVTREKEMMLAYIGQHPDSYYCLDRLYSKYIGYFPDGNLADSIFTLFSPEMRNTSLGKEYTAKIEVWKKTSLGAIAPDFTQNDPDGKPVNLSGFRGKYVLLDFWASWCGPCRRENPNVVKAYTTFKDKGFTVLGVSLDNGMRNGREAWLKAIKDDNLTWTQVSDLNYWENEVAILYNVGSVPTNYLLDPEGKIIDKNLRGEALIKKLAEILD